MAPNNRSHGLATLEKLGILPTGREARHALEQLPAGRAPDFILLYE